MKHAAMTDTKAKCPNRRAPGYFFRAWRKHRRLTQEQVAERVGLAVSSISQIESGKQGFTERTLASFAAALDVTAGDLLSRDPRTAGDPEFPAWASELVALLDRAKSDPEAPSLVYRIVEAHFPHPLRAGLARLLILHPERLTDLADAIDRVAPPPDDPKNGSGRR